MTSLVERVSRLTVFLRNNDRQSKPIVDGLVKVLQALHFTARRSITLTVERSLRTGLTYLLGLARRLGIVIRKVHGKKAPLKIPIDVFVNGYRERSIR
jgi:hypothetical protein